MSKNKQKPARFLTEADLEAIGNELKKLLFKQAESLGLAREWVEIFKEPPNF